MSIILHLETASDVCSVCVAENGKLIGIEERKEKNKHAVLLHDLVDTLLKNLSLSYSAIDACAVSMGPGSYTGLRIGVSAAKGYCFSLDKPLIAVNTLQSLTALYIQHLKKTDFTPTDLFCPMLDARRMEVYNALFNTNLNFIESTNARILDVKSFEEKLSNLTIHFFGDGALKFQKILPECKNAIFNTNFSTSSSGMIHLANEAFLSLNFVDLAYFEPFYLKDFVTSTSL